METIIEEWWMHLGCYDRQQASGLEYNNDAADYLSRTDDWWDNLNDSEKEEVYNDYFSEE